uniref:Fanconi anaemia group A protein helical domain-containing protein n=1 Tax=Amphimedon queenslandica TaxID=400682 RepID=A0A1X7TIN3_AMPQE
METHIDFERLLEELGSESTNLPDISQGWSDGLRRAIDHQAMSLSQSPETFGTWLLINKLKETNDDKVIDGVDYDYIDTSSTEDNVEINQEFSMAEVELNDILSSFEANNCQTIPNKLLEYQMFNLPYYTGRILRLLLAPRQVPSPPNTRERLIEALKKRDKSHQSMFAKYERECKKLNNSTSNGEGSSSSKMLLMYSPLEEKLERLKRHYEDNEDQLGPILSQVSTAINQVVSDIKKSIINNNDKSSKKHSGDICSPGLKEWEIQVVELLLKYVTEIIIKISLPLHEILCVSLYKEAVIYQDIAIRWQPCCALESLAIQDSTDYCLFFMSSLVHVNTEGMLKAAKFYCHFFHNLLTSGGGAGTYTIYVLHINVDFVLSLDITHHLITGLKQSLDKTPSLWSLAELFLEKCPILLTSILYHWSELCVLSEDNIMKENMSKEMTNICEWAK